MKKKLLFLSLILGASLISRAQITITSSNAPTAGHIVVVASDTNYVGKTVGNAGANQTWNFANWTNHIQEISNIVAPATLSGYSSFPTSNLAFEQEDGTQIFLNLSSTSLNTLGAYIDYTGNADFTPVKFNPSEKMITFPSTYNTTYSGTYSFSASIAYTAQPPMDSIRMASTVVYSSVIDGWGTVTTPTNSNVNCLRQKIRNITTTTTSIHYIVWIPVSTTTDTTYDYNWWSNSFSYMVAKMATDSAGTVTSANWLLAYTTAGIDEENTTAKKEIKVFPNPATTQSTVLFSQLKEEGEIVVYNTLGQLIYEEKLAKGISQTQLNVEGFKQGIYKVIIKEKGAIKAQESLIKN